MTGGHRSRGVCPADAALHDLLALPVVDDQNRLVGMITTDDATGVLEEEATEDIQRLAARLAAAALRHREPDRR